MFADAGNSRLKLRMGRHGSVHAIRWQEIDDQAVAAELVTYLEGHSRPDGLVVCAAVPEAQQARLQDLLAQVLPEVEVAWLKVHRRKGGVRPAYEDPAKFGVDRYMALLAARAKHRNRAVVVLDLGTAVTVDAMDRGGRHLGGLILPGLSMLSAALHQRLPQLACEEEPGGRIPEDALLPVTTEDAVAMGTHAFYVGGIEQIVVDLCQRMEADPVILACGGDAAVFCQASGLEIDQQPNLVLDGMVLAARR
ncbi:MAG: type III pantothenate kinase [Halothiobacillaceae bacterium]